MIFLTLGTQLPFERLVRAVDAWAGARQAVVFAQIPDPGEGGYVPRHMEWTARLAPEDFTRRCESAQVIVSHAGMGSIITALSLAKPLILMARRSALGEHR
ncbi:MAG: glycosyltransferase, partial [Pseudomonadota bacterium]